MAETKKQEIAKVPTTAIAKYTKVFGDIVNDMGIKSGLILTPSQRLNVTLGGQKVFQLCKEKGIDPNTQLDQSQISELLFNIAVLNLNPLAEPHQIYLTPNKTKMKNGVQLYSIDLGIEGDGNDTLVRKHGVDVKSLSVPYLVREGDAFTFPSFDGEKMVAPTWTQKSLDKPVILVFYVLKKTDGSIEYPMASRESVATNLKAHINRNLNGVSEKQKAEILEKIEDMTLEEMLKDKSLRNIQYQKYDFKTKTYSTDTKSLISPAWTAPHSRESMIIRKMRNNALKKYPKNFENAFAQAAYEKSFEENQSVESMQDVVEADYEVKSNSEEVQTSIPMNEETGEVKVEEPVNEEVQEAQPQEPVEEEFNEY